MEYCEPLCSVNHHLQTWDWNFMAKKVSIHHCGFICKTVYYNPGHNSFEVCKVIAQN